MIRKSVLIFMVVVVLLALKTDGLALDPDKAVTQYMMETWNDSNGLPQNSVRIIRQTADGYLWLGTEEGLVRFDGVSFTIFDEANTPEITNNYIFDIFEDSRKNLWIATRGGLLVYKRGKFKPFNREEFAGAMVQVICEDHEKNLWLGTDGDGLFRLKNGRLEKYTEKEGLPHSIIRILYIDSSGTLWIGTSGGLGFFKDGKFHIYTEDKDFADMTVVSIYEDGKKNLWVGSEQGLHIIKGDKRLLAGGKTGNDFGKVFAIFEDGDENLWIGTSDKGLIRCQNGRFSAFTKKDGLPDNTIKEIREDKEGSLWLGTAYGGLIRLKDGKFTTITTREGLSDDLVFAIYEDSRNYLWIGTNNGLNRFKDGEFLHITTRHGLTNNVIECLFEGRDGFIWVGTDDGVNKIKNRESGIRKVSEYVRGRFILGLFGDKTGNIWAGTNNKLFKIKPNLSRPEELTPKEGLGSNIVNFIHEDKKGNIWFSTYRSGLTLYKEGNFTVFTEAHGLAGNSVNCIYEDPESILWIGTIDGLSRYKDGKFTSFTRKDGLFNNNIYQILEDAGGCLWMSCNKGIFKVRKQDLNEFAEKREKGNKDKAKRIVSTVYGREDGMLSTECNGSLQTPGCKTKDGKLWFPTGKGVVVIDPEKIKTNDVPPPVFIERFLLDGAPYDLNEKVTVTPGVKRVELHYTALSFLNPKKVKFKYMLQGYEDRWVDAGSQRKTFYTNLDAGDYRFRVIACNDDGLWNEAGASIPFTVIPHYWQVWWFKIMALLVFAVLSYLVISLFRKFLSLSRFWKREKHVGNFRLLEKVGSGGMGNIYRAKSLSDKTETVAIKVLKEELFDDENNRKRFKQEAAIIDQLDHPNIVKVIERGQTRQTMFIAMELLEGKNLSDKIKEDGKLDIFEALHIMIQVSDAVLKIHSKNIVHRDLKPDNIMLVQNGDDCNFVKLLDFGLAKTQYQTRLTQTGMVIGTINYMAPEQISGAGFSGATDVYSMGVMFYEMLTGVKPFSGETTIDIMKQIIDKDPIEPFKLRFDIPTQLNDAILEMMEKRQDIRPGAGDVLVTMSKIQMRLKE